MGNDESNSQGGRRNVIRPANGSVVPDELRSHDRWLVAKITPEGRKPPLKPADPTATDDALGFKEAKRLVDEPERDRTVKGRVRPQDTLVTGFMFSSDDPIAMIDWDDVRDPAIGDGSIPEAVLNWVRELGVYTEISPSNTGLKQFIQMGEEEQELLENYGHRGELGLEPIGGLEEIPHVELYTENQYSTVTGNLFTDPCTNQQHISTDVNSQTVSRLIEEYLATSTEATANTESNGEYGTSKNKTSSGITALGEKSARQSKRKQSRSNGEIPGDWITINGVPTVEQIWATGCALDPDFQSLWRGHVSRYDSVSEADNALVSKLWYYCDQRKLVDRAFRASDLYGIRARQSSVSDRWSKSTPKWDNPSYRRGTLDSTEDNRYPSYEGRYLDPDAPSL